MPNQISGFERIAVVAAVLRGHELGEWRFEERFAAANCIWCSRELLVYDSLVEPNMGGAALEHTCLDERREILVRIKIRL